MRDFSNDLSFLALNTATLGHSLDGYGAGWLEMVCLLYQWSDKVEVLAPAGLHELVVSHQRSDFAALPLRY